jgi:plasmid stabilization system protein ParE
MKRYKVRLLPSAYDDLRNARDWYKQHGASLPKHFTDQLALTIDHIKVAPNAYAIRYKNIHVALLNVFPYAVHFFIIEESNTVIVIAIHHTAMDPEKWENRLK